MYVIKKMAAFSCCRILGIVAPARRQLLNKMHCKQFSSSNNNMVTGIPNNKLHFSFNDYDVIGFDLDCTLLRYNLNEMCPLIYEVLRDYLLQQGYPSSLRQKTIDLDFLQKGLILDDEHGNLLKLRSDSVIMRAAHGTRLLCDAEIVQFYGEQREWHVSSDFVQDPLAAWNGPGTECMRALLDYFDMPVALVFAQAVDAVDEQKQQSKQRNYGIWKDLLAALMQNYARENFANNKSAYFAALKANIARYVLPSSVKLLQWLHELRQAGKCIFLLTGSNADFANLTASQALGAQWQQLFDCVVSYAKKPGFFTQQRAFMRVENLQEVPGSELSLQELLPLNQLYTQGNWQQLCEAMAQKLGKPRQQLRTLYVGDNLIQDIYTPMKSGCGLHTVAVCEELLGRQQTQTHNFEFQPVLCSQFWGSYFYLHNAPTLWTQLINNYAQLCVPHMEWLATQPITHKYSKVLLSHE